LRRLFERFDLAGRAAFVTRGTRGLVRYMLLKS
jgi:hypothetical protein